MTSSFQERRHNNAESSDVESSPESLTLHGATACGRPPTTQLRITERSALNRPTQDWGVFLGDVPAATAILDRFLAHAEIVPMTGKSYRLRQRSSPPSDA
jgi:hypothetical protein